MRVVRISDARRGVDVLQTGTVSHNLRRVQGETIIVRQVCPPGRIGESGANS